MLPDGLDDLIRGSWKDHICGTSAHRACTNICLPVGGARLGMLLVDGGKEAEKIMLLLLLTHFLSALTTATHC